MNTFSRCRRRRAFTLIELLVVISIMVVLMGLLVVAGLAVRRTARQEASKAAVQLLVTAIDSYYRDYHAYPQLRPGDVSELGGNAEFSTLYWDGSQWTPEGINAAVVYQLLLPRGNGPYLDSNAKLLRFPRDSSDAEKRITVDGIDVRVAVDSFDEPIRIAWMGAVRVRNSGQYYRGWFTEGPSEYLVTTLDGQTHTVTYADAAQVERTGLRLWSLGEDRKPNTRDDLPPVIVGR